VAEPVSLVSLALVSEVLFGLMQPEAALAAPGWLEGNIEREEII
jgi:hypothetical protein